MNHILVATWLLIVEQSFGARVNITQNLSNAEGVLFRVNFEKKIKFTIPDECAELDICEEIDDFPEDEIKELIDLLVASKVNFNQDHETLEHHNDEKEGINLCLSKYVFFRPKAVRVDGEWRLVLNSKDNMVQSFLGEKCLEGLNARCSNLVSFSRGYEGRCIQKYTNRHMILLSKNYKEVIVLPRAVPTCCSCMAFAL